MTIKPITTLLFDCDETLLHTKELCIQTYLNVMGKHLLEIVEGQLS
ncbi:hypothetical protein [Paenisporosarcina antarctica]|nr:hypothetical protein [Paenisporosarcina antarctica]